MLYLLLTCAAPTLLSPPPPPPPLHQSPPSSSPSPRPPSPSSRKRASGVHRQLRGSNPFPFPSPGPAPLSGRSCLLPARRIQCTIIQRLRLPVRASHEISAAPHVQRPPASRFLNIFYELSPVVEACDAPLIASGPPLQLQSGAAPATPNNHRSSFSLPPPLDRRRRLIFWSFSLHPTTSAGLG